MITKSEIERLNMGLRGKHIRLAGIDQHGMLWVRGTGHGETPDDLDAAMGEADAYLRAMGYRRDPDAQIFRQGLDWGQNVLKSGNPGIPGRIMTPQELKIMAAALPVVEAVPAKQDMCWPGDGPAHDDQCRLTDHTASAAAVKATEGLRWDFGGWAATARWFRELVSRARGMTGAVLDLRGKRFCRLFVSLDAEPVIRGHAYWPCVCQCGAHTLVRGTKLRSGRIVSCGCWRRDGEHQRLRAERKLRADRRNPRRIEIRLLRRRGLTWAAIGDRLGITRQAAQQAGTYSANRRE